ncbi:methyltransferase domain-containing protein [Hirsutella rhossiliensis]|uniref:catechol O-methyltransferase n=1 Tax=Hirsutella rhossiliensis TaxID=111463 RepID=A0A9P8MRA1_9HYPO|nr:methyltransferase domain-containing protein [Hirsutella rhossiliensis]KAH0959632.1 methyltransferase domain-containing protein [Hirsutella rhossiliensis]
MNVGEHKGAIVTGLIGETKPQVMLELGGYVGYSAILFGAALQKAGGRRYISLERNPEFAAVASSLVDLAGLAAVVHVVVGPSADSLRRLHSHGHLARIDLSSSTTCVFF